MSVVRLGKIARKKIKVKFVDRESLTVLNNKAFMESRARYINPFDLLQNKEWGYNVVSARKVEEGKTARISFSVDGKPLEVDMTLEDFQSLPVYEVTIEYTEEDVIKENHAS